MPRPVKISNTSHNLSKDRDKNKESIGALPNKSSIIYYRINSEIKVFNEKSECNLDGNFKKDQLSLSTLLFCQIPVNKEMIVL